MRLAALAESISSRFNKQNIGTFVVLIWMILKKFDEHISSLSSRYILRNAERLCFYHFVSDILITTFKEKGAFYQP